MLAFEVDVEAAELLPLHDGEHGVQGVQVGHLDVSRVLVVPSRRGERHAVVLANVVAFLRRTGRYTKNAAEAIIRLLDPHADIDERNAALLELGHDDVLELPAVEAKEHELHLSELSDVPRGDAIRVRDDAPSEL